MCDEYCQLTGSICDLRNEAYEKAIKYQWDPVVGPAHKSYLDALNLILDKLNEVRHAQLSIQ